MRLSLRDLANVIGSDASTLSMWERGIVMPQFNSSWRWVEALDALEADENGMLDAAKVKASARMRDAKYDGNYRWPGRRVNLIS